MNAKLTLWAFHGKNEARSLRCPILGGVVPPLPQARSQAKIPEGQNHLQ